MPVHVALGNRKLCIDDLGVLYELVITASVRWHALGLQLGVRPGELERIEHEYVDPRDRLREMLRCWLKQTSFPSMPDLVAALRKHSVEEIVLAQELEDFHLTYNGKANKNMVTSANLILGSLLTVLNHSFTKCVKYSSR